MSVSKSQYGVGGDPVARVPTRWTRKRRSWRRLGGTVAVLATSAGALLGTAGGAEAYYPRPPVVDATVIASPNVNVRPGAPTLGPDMSRIIGQIPYGTSVQIDCVEVGPPETGPFGTTSLWDRLPGYQGNNPAAWVSDAWIDTGRNDPSVDNSGC